jgi:hypothetical protein
MATLVIILLLLMSLAAAYGLGRRRRLRRAAVFLNRLRNEPPVSVGQPPDRLARAARAGGAGQGGPWRMLRITQEARFRFGPDKPWFPMPATQHIALGAPGFVWDARRPGPFLPRMTVIDAYVAGEGHLFATLLGAIPVADRAGPVLARAEAMRYLAEIPWAPEAILGNPALVWAQVSETEVDVTLPLDPDPATVRLILNTADDIVSIEADRPETRPDGTTRTRPWRGYFSDFGDIGGRRIPRAGEVGYLYDDGYHAYWQGRVTGYELLP